MKTQAQLLGQPLIYIIIIVVMGLTLIFGYNTLRNLHEVQEHTLLSSFILELEDITRVFYNYNVGSSNTYTFTTLPQKITNICFYNPDNPITTKNLNTLDPRLEALLTLNNDNNIFIIPLDAYPSPAPDYSIQHLRAGRENPLCLRVTNGKLELAVTTILHNNAIFVEIQPA